MIAVSAGLLLAVIGPVIALVAVRRTLRRVSATVAAAQALIDPERVDSIAQRLQADEAALSVLLVRARAAVERLNRSFDELRLPQAVFALRTAGAAIRLLLSGR